MSDNLEKTTANVTFGRLNVNINGFVTTIICSILTFIFFVIASIMIYEYKKIELNKKYETIICPYCNKTIKTTN